MSLEDNCLYGKILFIKDLVTYQSDNPAELEQEFKDAVDDYLETCAEIGVEPKQPFSGSFNVRIGPEAHEKLAMLAVSTDRKMNDVVKQAVTDIINNQKEVHHHHHKTIEFKHRFEAQPSTGGIEDEQLSIDHIHFRAGQASQH